MQITFSEPVDPATVNGTTVKVRAGASEAAGTVGCADDTATFTPAANWGFATTYTVTISGGPSGVKDMAGNPPSAAYTCTFTTGQAHDTNPPTVTGMNPANGAAGISIFTSITVTFSEAVTNVAPTTFRLTTGATQVPGTLLDNGSTVAFLPSAPLSAGTAKTASSSRTAGSLQLTR